MSDLAREQAEDILNDSLASLGEITSATYAADDRTFEIDLYRLPPLAKQVR
jgi:hypothetical protein